MEFYITFLSSSVQFDSKAYFSAVEEVFLSLLTLLEKYRSKEIVKSCLHMRSAYLENEIFHRKARNLWQVE